MEREGDEIDSPSPAVEWVTNTPGEGGLRRARFRLGDFAGFGSFLAELIGAESRKEKE